MWKCTHDACMRFNVVCRERGYITIIVLCIYILNSGLYTYICYIAGLSVYEIRNILRYIHFSLIGSLDRVTCASSIHTVEILKPYFQTLRKKFTNFTSVCTGGREPASPCNNFRNLWYLFVGELQCTYNLVRRVESLLCSCAGVLEHLSSCAWCLYL